MENAEIILELLSRIQRLEKQVTELKRIIDQLSKDIGEKNSEGVAMPTNRSSVAPTTNQRFDYEGDVKRRDTTKYLFDGAVYSKNRLVLAVVKDFVSKKTLSFDELEKVFHPSLQGSLGVVVRKYEAERRQDYRVRFFTDGEDILKLSDCYAYVCNQWGILNIPRFLTRVKELGYNVQPLS